MGENFYILLSKDQGHLDPKFETTNLELDRDLNPIHWNHILDMAC